jgi:hypothetical protein
MKMSGPVIYFLKHTHNECIYSLNIIGFGLVRYFQNSA